MALDRLKMYYLWWGQVLSGDKNNSMLVWALSRLERCGGKGGLPKSVPAQGHGKPRARAATAAALLPSCLVHPSIIGYWEEGSA